MSNAQIFRYALLGLPLGCIGLPLYLHLPKYYADHTALSLTTLGVIMFFTRLLDCFADPWIGYGLERFSRYRYVVVSAAAIGLVLGVIGLFWLPAFAAWLHVPALIILLGVAYFSYSVLLIHYYADGLTYSAEAHEQTRLSAWRESAIIIGVLIASIVPSLLADRVDEIRAYHFFSYGFAVVLMLTLWLQRRDGSFSSTHLHSPDPPIAVLREHSDLRWIFTVFFINALAPAITTTLFLFFISDVLHLSAWSGGFLLAYFVSAVLAMPFWVWMSGKIGKKSALLFAMLIALLAFACLFGIHAEQGGRFLAVCVISGFALGGDLTLLPAMLSALLHRHKRQGSVEFGLWNFISKFTLALAAGVALPLLDFFSYTPSSASASGIMALTYGYILLPFLCKLLAAFVLYRSPLFFTSNSRLS